MFGLWHLDHRFRGLLQVGPDHRGHGVDVGSALFFRHVVGPKMRSDMTLNNFRHKTIHCATDCSNLLQNGRAIGVQSQGPFERVGLPLDSANPGEQRFLGSDRVAHRDIVRSKIYWGTVCAMTSSVPTHARSSNPWQHTHIFDEGNPLAERNTLLAVVLTAVMMVVEIVGGWRYNSMALLADGWHMSSHALALGLSVIAYAAARRLAGHSRFAFGTWKVEILGGYTSAVLLSLIALLMAYQSVERLISPSVIHYDEAIGIGAVGLMVNLVCAWLLRSAHHGHRHDHGHGHGGHGHDEDLNLRSAYVHVLADAATSVLAIVALFGGKLWGASWLDPLMGLIGAMLVAAWAFSLMRDSGKVLLDAEMNAPVVEEVREVIAESPVPATISDLHVWRVGKGKYACILALVTSEDASPDYFKKQLAIHEELVHISIEVNRSPA